MKSILILIFLFSIVQTHASTRCNEGDQEFICVIAGATADTDKAQSVGHARSLALKSARLLAYEKLAERLKGVLISSSSSMENQLLNNEQIKSAVQAKIRNVNFEKESISFLSDGSAWAEVTLSVQNPFFKKDEKILEYQNGVDTLDNSYHGLVILAKDLGWTPGLMPKIVSDTGKVIYSGNASGFNFLPGMSTVKVFKKLEQARSSLNTTGRLLELKAEKIGKNGEIILNRKDSIKLFRADLGQGQIAIVY